MRVILPLAHSQGAVLFLRAIVHANIADPALMRFLTGTINIAATPGHPMAPRLHSRWADFHTLVQGSLAHDIETGREPATMLPHRGAEHLVAVYEGLQLQSMVRPGMDLLDSFDRGHASSGGLVGCLRPALLGRRHQAGNFIRLLRPLTPFEESPQRKGISHPYGRLQVTREEV